jgi:hypothetical protein
MKRQFPEAYGSKQTLSYTENYMVACLQPSTGSKGQEDKVYGPDSYNQKPY